MMLQFPRREPGALKQGPSFIRLDPDAFSLFMSREKNSEGRAVFRRRESAGVAMREQAVAIRDQFRSDASHRSAHLRIFVADRFRFGQQS